MSLEIPEGWKVSTFGEVMDFKGGTQPPKSTFAYKPTSGYVRLLQIRDFESDDKPAYISEDVRSSKCSNDDILIARYGASLGRILRGLSGAYNVALVKIILLNGRLTSDFAYHWLCSKTFQSHLLSVGNRSAQAGFNKEDLSPLSIVLPPLSEQHCIAEILSSVDEAIQATRAVIEQTRKVKQGVLERLLTKGIGHKRFKQTGIGEIPEEWEVATLGSIANFQPGYPFKSAEFVVAGDRLLRGSNIAVGGTDWSAGSTKFFPANRRMEYGEYVLAPGDIVIAMDRPFISGGFKTARIRQNDLPALLLQRVGRFQVTDRCDTDWLWQITSSGSLRIHLEQHQVGTDLPHISKKDIESCMLAIPPVTEQRLIAEHVSDMDRAMEIATVQLETLFRTKFALMSDLLTGRKRVPTDLRLAAE